MPVGRKAGAPEIAFKKHIGYTRPIDRFDIDRREERSMKDKKGFSRRVFLGKTLAGAAGVGLIGLKGLPAVQGQNPAPAVAGGLITRTLGKTGISLPVVSMGVMNADVPALVQRAHELGIRHFDTAAVYQRGRNEEMVGRVVQDLGVRDKTIIATKVWNPQYRNKFSKDEARAKYLEQLEASLKRLRTDYVDIVYIHDVSEVKDLSDPGILEGMAAAKKEGKARAVGFSTHREMGACLAEALKLGCFDVVLTAYNYSLHPYPELLATMNKAAASGIGLIAMKTQCQQEWYREELPAELQAYYQGTVIHSALLKWVLNHACFTTAVPGFTNFDQIQDDVACASHLDYSPAEKNFLEDRKVKLAVSAACRQCGSCVATCPRGSDIPSLMRAHMYAFSYGNPIQASETLASPPVLESFEMCGHCDSCRASCSGRVPIGRRIDQLRQVFA